MEYHTTCGEDSENHIKETEWPMYTLSCICIFSKDENGDSNFILYGRIRYEIKAKSYCYMETTYFKPSTENDINQ